MGFILLAVLSCEAIEGVDGLILGDVTGDNQEIFLFIIYTLLLTVQ